MKKIALLASLLLYGCPGVSLDDSLVDNRAPPPPRPNGGQYREPTCETFSYGSGQSCNPYGNPDGGVADSGVRPDGGMNPDAGPPCNEHTFEYENANASTVWVTGSFTSWAATPAEGALELTKSGARFTLTTQIEPPGTHQYKLVIDGTDWIPDPTNPDRTPDGFGGENSLLTLCEASCGDLEAFDWRDSVMYFVMVDRFFNGDASNDAPIPGASGGGNAATGSSGQYEGGDLAGVTEKMGYLADLGVTALWLSAPYDNRDTLGYGLSDANQYTGYHGYWPKPENTDYSDLSNPIPRPKVESRIGTEADLRSMIDAAHGAGSANGDGIKVLFDYVMNHVDVESPLYQAHPDWFAREGNNFKLCGSDCGGQSCWDDSYWGTRCAFTEYLPPFDYGNDTARAWSIDDAIWWAKEFGIDGYRLDAIKHVPLSWLTDLRTRLNTEIPNPAGDRFYLVGETFDYFNRDLLKSFVNPETMLDGQFDFPFKAQACSSIFGGAGMQSLADWMAGNDHFYGEGSLMTTWVGNHDIPRAIHYASGQIGNCTEGSHGGNSWTTNYQQPQDARPYEMLGLAFAVMMTNPGIPLIYYGDEIGLAGGGDPDNRRLMPWNPADVNAHQVALRELVRKLAFIRAENKVLSRGRRTTLSAGQDTWVYRMSGCGDGAPPVVVAINRADQPRTVELPAGPLRELITDAQVAGGATELPARSVMVLR